MTPQEYCLQKAQQSGSSFFSSFLSLPNAKRDAIIALYAFCREVDDIVDDEGDHNIKRIKLQWWRDEITRLFSQQAQHPITKALTPILTQFNLSQQYFMEILDGMTMDLDQVHYQTYADLDLYCYRVAGVVGLMSAEIFGYQHQHTLQYARELGIAFQLTNIIRDVHEDASKGRLYLPTELLSAHQVNPEDIRHGRQTAQFTAAIRELCERARKHYHQAYAALPKQDRYAQRAGLIMAEVYQTLLTEIERDGFQVLRHRITLPKWRKFILALKVRIREAWLARRFQSHHV